MAVRYPPPLGAADEPKPAPGNGNGEGLVKNKWLQAAAWVGIGGFLLFWMKALSSDTPLFPK